MLATFLFSTMSLAAANFLAPQQEVLSPLPLQLSAEAQSADITVLDDPQGDEHLYVMNCGIITEWGVFDYPSLKSEIRFDADGQTVYFHNLFPRYKECWVKGTIEGTEIVIPSGQAIYNDAQYGEVYFYASRAGEDGVFNTIDDMRLTLSTDEQGQKHIASADTTVLGGVVKMDDDGAGYLVLNGYYEMEEFLDPIVELPAGLATEQYVITYQDYYWMTFSKAVEVAFDGDDVYLQGLIPDADETSGWVKGHIEGDYLCVPSRQGAYSGTYLLSFFAGYAADYDDYGDPVFGSQDTLKLQISADRKDISSVEGDYALTVYGNRQRLIYAIEQIHMFAYDGDKPAVPATPTLNAVDQAFVEFNMPLCDVDGNYINPNLYTWSAFIDGELVTFDPDEYICLWEPMSEFEYSFTDHYDFMAYGDTHMFFIYDLLFEVLEIQTYYTVDGVRNASEKARYGLTPDGLMALGEDVNVQRVEYFDLQGRPLAARQGICVARMTLSNGTVKTYKLH